MKENQIIVISSYSKKNIKDPNNLYNSVQCPPIFNKNNSIFIINDKMEKIEFGKNISFSQLIKNNKAILLKLFEKDNLNMSGVSGQSFFDIFNNENLEDNELLVDINSLIEKGVFEKSSSDQEIQSNSKSINLFYIVKDNDIINNQLSYNKNEDFIKELEKKIETLIKDKENILDINKKLTDENESLKKENNKLYQIIDSLNSNYDIIKKYEEEIKQLKESILLEKKKKLNDNDNLKKNKNLTYKNENEKKNDFEIQKIINEMRKEYNLDQSFSDGKLYEVLKENNFDVELSFSNLFP